MTSIFGVNGNSGMTLNPGQNPDLNPDIFPNFKQKGGTDYHLESIWSQN